MKKILLSSIISMFYILSASAEVGLSVGVSGSAGGFYMSATELDTGTHGTTSGTDETIDGDATGAAGWASVFVEKTLGDHFAVGVDFVTEDIGTETATKGKADKTTSATAATVTNDVQVDFSNLTTLYVNFNVSESAYIKAGIMNVDVITNETLGTGSTYGNTSLQGTTLGIGWIKSMDSGIFVRAEGAYMDFEGKSLTSSSGSQKITLDALQGVHGKLSIGKTF